MPSRKIIIGDVHGCDVELRWLLRSLQPFDITDTVVFLGDLIDKGPDTPGVVKQVRELASLGGQPTVIALMGNHEERFLRFCRYEMSSGHNPMQYVPDEFHDHIKKLSMTDILWLEKNLRLTYQFKHNSKQYICTHGGISNSTTFVPKRDDKRKVINPWLRLRYVNPEGHFVRLGAEQPGDKFWAEVYRGHIGTALFGHQPFMDQDSPLEKFDYAIPLDGGCVHGGQLRALVLDKGQHIVAVDAMRKYSEIYKPVE